MFRWLDELDEGPVRVITSRRVYHQVSGRLRPRLRQNSPDFRDIGTALHNERVILECQMLNTTFINCRSEFRQRLPPIFNNLSFDAASAESSRSKPVNFSYLNDRYREKQTLKVTPS